MHHPELADEPHHLLHIEGALAAIDGQHQTHLTPWRGGAASRCTPSSHARFAAGLLEEPPHPFQAAATPAQKPHPWSARLAWARISSSRPCMLRRKPCI